MLVFYFLLLLSQQGHNHLLSWLKIGLGFSYSLYWIQVLSELSNWWFQSMVYLGNNIVHIKLKAYIIFIVYVHLNLILFLAVQAKLSLASLHFFLFLITQKNIPF